ncbi:MAG: Fe-S protein assembly co-chaperone HscB [Deltaproteobacteria bacterium]|nr:Fe-S protein assembly co-chaperone HscB [Deltaproteobacteria bacterium]
MTTVAVLRCWRCAHEHSATLFCPRCSAVQPLPPQTDYFTVFGLPLRPAIDEAGLTQRYYDLSRRLHPDLYQAGTAEEKDASLKNTVLLNRAYRTLRDLITRGQYWLEMQGEALGKENNRVPPTLAALVFEVQEKLAEIRDARAAGDGEVDIATLTEIRADLDGQMQRLRTALVGNLEQWPEPSRSQELLVQLKRLLSEIAYLRTLLRDVEKESEVSWNA